MKKVTNGLCKGITAISLLLMCCVSSMTIRAQTVIGWNLNGLTNALNGFGPSPYSATTASVYINAGSGLIRGGGVGTSGTSADRAWGGNTWTMSDKASAISGNTFITFTLNVKSGYTLSLDSITPFDYRRSKTGPDTGVVQYSLDGVNFIDIIGVKYDTLLGGANLGNRLSTIYLSGIGALQNLTFATTVTFRIVNWRGTNVGGTWYLYDKPSTSGPSNDFAINGNVTELSTNWYQSKTVGNWNAVTTWNSGPTSTGSWLPALAPPTSLASGIELLNGHTVSLQSDQTINGLLNLNTGSVLNINGYTLTWRGGKGSTTGTGTLSGSSTSSLVIDSVGVGTLRFTPGSDYLKTLKVLKLSTLVTSLNIVPQGTVKVMASLNISTGSLTLQSSALGTARIDSSAASINGTNVTVERYIPARRAWRLLTSTLTSSATQTINSAWQEGVTNPHTYGLLDPKPGYGTQISKSDSSDVANGYDANLERKASVTVMDNATPTPIASTFIPINTYRSYFLFVRGNRANQIALGTSAPTSTTTLRTKGAINQGSVNVGITIPAGKYFGIGNIYPSAIDITSLISGFTGSTNVDATTFARWDPGINPLGGYIQYVGGVSSPSTTNYPTTASTFVMQSGEAFILKASGVNPVVKFKESLKTTMNSSTVFARTAPPTVHINLYDSSLIQVDGVAIGFADSASVPKFGKTGELMMISADDAMLGIQIQPLHKVDTFRFEFLKLTLQTYHLRLTQELKDLDADLEFVDSFLQKHMDLKGITNGYAFTVTADTASYKHRFMLIAKAKHIHVQPPHHHHDKKLSVYPNPVYGKLYIEYAGKPYVGRVTITDISGRVIPFISMNGALDCSLLARGLYILHAGGETITFTKL